MGEKKSIEIECPKCQTRFRLWVPVRLLPEWKNGGEIGCVMCGMRIKLEKDNDNFQVAPEQLIEPIPAAIAPDKTGEGAYPKNAQGEIILIVDDDGLVRKMAENVLTKNNFTPLTAQNGPEALGIIEKEMVAVVVVDLHLKNSKDQKSVMDGEEFLQKLAGLGKNIPAIVTTGKDLIDDIILEPKWYNLHVMAFIQKGNPFWTDDLLTKIKEILKRDS